MGYIVNYVNADSMKNPVLSAGEKPKTPNGGCGKSKKDSCGTSDREANNKSKKTGEPVTGPVSIYAIAEMNKRAEEYTLKVRSERFRIGCSPADLSVLGQGVYLQMKYQQQIILVSPQEVLGVLHKIPRGTELPEIWERICQHAHKLEKQKRLNRGWSVAVFFSLLLLAAFLIISRV
jgi:hypothetical protein